MNILEEIRPDLRTWKPYASARSLIQNKNDLIFLDANENPFGQWNRYPDPLQHKLKTALAHIKNISREHIFIGNGSDEVLDLCMRLFCVPGKDKVLICPPTYGMYEVLARLNMLDLIQVPLLPEAFTMDIDSLRNTIHQHQPKILILCSPNNPTGNVLANISDIFEFYNGWLLVDEAYIDFCPEKSCFPLLQKFPRLIIIQTLSKAWAMAGLRIGMAFAHPGVVHFLNAIKPPYNVNELSMQKAYYYLTEKKDEFEKNRKIIVQQREELALRLKDFSFIEKIYPSDANFLLVKSPHSERWKNFLQKNGIIIRDRSSQISNCVRISIGTPEENSKLIEITHLFEKTELL